jgi:hypothetical protein
MSPIWGSWPKKFTVWPLRSCFCGAPTRTGLSFVYAACPCQHNLSWVRVPWDSRPHFTVSDLRLPFSSPPTTRRVMAEVEIKVMLQLTVIRPVCFGVRPPSGAQDQIYYCQTVADLLMRGALSDEMTQSFRYSDGDTPQSTAHISSCVLSDIHAHRLYLAGTGALSSEIKRPGREDQHSAG